MSESAYRFLTKAEILELLGKDLLIEPLLLLEQVQSTGVDLRLDSRFREFRRARHGILDLSQETPEEEVYEFAETRIKGCHTQDMKKFYLDIEPIFLQAGEFIVTQTYEYISMPTNLMGFLDGRSSLARLGTIIHATAGSIAPGFKGHITLELGNIGKMPVKLCPLSRVASLHLARVKDVPSYEGQFQHQVRVKPPKPDDDLVRLLGRSVSSA